MNLSEFLLARIDEDEAAAREAQEAMDYIADGREVDVRWEWVRLYKPTDRTHGWSSAHEPGVPTPSRVLAECESKRRVMARAQTALRWDRDPTGAPTERVADFAWHVLEALALPYADHPDYDGAWG